MRGRICGQWPAAASVIVLLCFAAGSAADGVHLKFERTRRVLVGYEVRGKFLVPVFDRVGRRIELTVDRPRRLSDRFDRGTSSSSGSWKEFKRKNRKELDKFFRKIKKPVVLPNPPASASAPPKRVTRPKRVVRPQPRRGTDEPYTTTVVGLLKRDENGHLTLTTETAYGAKVYMLEADEPAQELLDEKGEGELRVVMVGVAVKREGQRFLRVRSVRPLDGKAGKDKTKDAVEPKPESATEQAESKGSRTETKE